MTVSRVINGKNNVAEETRQKVLQVIDELGYVPHLQAQRLASGRTRTIVLHYPLSNPRLVSNLIEMNFITGIAQGAAEEEYYFSLVTGALTPVGIKKLCRGAQADGLVLMQIALRDWRVDLLREQEYPFVMIGRTENTQGLAFVDFDIEKAIGEAYAYLFELGHRHIGFLTFPEEWRIQGLGGAMRALNALKRAARRFKVAPLYRESDLNTKRGYWAAKSLLAENPQLTAFVTVHNTLTVGAITALQEAERNVPQDCSILDIANSDESELITPPLTGMQWPSYDIGFQAAKMLIRQLKGESFEREQMLMSPKLSVRGSTAPPPG
jgi:LacI family transcriptional regulator, galactose operon repressor